MTAQQDTATTPGPSPSVAAALTPVQLREWRRAAQRTVRLALTGTRSAWSEFQSASERGHAALSAMSDALLLLVSGRRCYRLLGKGQ